MDVTTEVRDGYLYVRATGSFSLEAARDACRRWTDATASRGERCVVLDVTAVVNFDVVDVPVMLRFELGQALVDSLPADIRLAIVETPAQFDPERFGETVMANRGIMVKITTSLDDAVQWLSAWRRPTPVPVIRPS
ncbi:MAG: hypothetical protein U0Q55_09240 [Vicinamibacterales bacterium]